MRSYAAERRYNRKEGCTLCKGDLLHTGDHGNERWLRCAKCDADYTSFLTKFTEDVLVRGGDVLWYKDVVGNLPYVENVIVKKTDTDCRLIIQGIWVENEDPVQDWLQEDLYEISKGNLELMMEKPMEEHLVELRKAAQVPEISYLVSEAVHLSMLGLKIIPEHLWGKVISILENQDEVEYKPKFEKAGFIFAENHLRSEMHIGFQIQLSQKHEGAFVIPIEELLGDDELITITRFLFEGSEEELCKAIDNLA